MKLPLEVCRIARVCRYDRELTGEQRSLMIDQTRLQPRQRRERISLRPLIVLLNNDRMLKAFGLTIATPDQPMQAPARLLDTPVLLYGKNEAVSVATGTGDWGRETGRLQFADPAQNRAIKVA